MKSDPLESRFFKALIKHELEDWLDRWFIYLFWEMIYLIFKLAKA